MGPFSFAVAKNSSAGITPVYPEVKGMAPSAPAITWRTVFSLVENGILNLSPRVLKIAKPTNAAGMGIALTIPA
jgi:hypothetical protein